VFYEGEAVRSRYHGLGEIISAGRAPRVRFLDGRECSVPGDTIMSVPQEVYDAEVHNRTVIERFLTARIYGSAPSHAASLPRPEVELTAAMRRHAQLPRLPFAELTPLGGSVLDFD